MAAIENKIRDNLVNRLDVFEEGMTYLDKESFLPNDKGTRGFVDLLARDSLNRYVLIELKRSDSVARQAIHEVLKYIEGIKENKSLKNDEFVAYIVSTEWRELLVPFSSLVKKVSYDVIGYNLTIDENLTPVSAERIRPLALTNERLLSDQHAICLYTTEEKLQQGIKSHIDCFSQKGINDFVLLVLDTHPDFREHELHATMKGLEDVAKTYGGAPSMTLEELKNQMPEYRHMVYSAVQVMDPEKYWAILEKDEETYAEVKEYEESFDEEEFQETLHEYAIENAKPRPFQEFYEIGYPAKLQSKLLEQEKWQIRKLIRGGRLAENDLLSDELLIDELAGAGGSNRQKYSKEFYSSNSAVFDQLSKEIKQCLINNEIWSGGLVNAVEEIGDLSKRHAFQGRVNIYNPSNTLLSINLIATSADLESAMRWVPNYYISIEGSSIKRAYFGCLERCHGDADLEKVFEAGFENGESELLLSLTWGGYLTNDIDLGPLFGLAYANFKVELENSRRNFFKFDGFRYEECGEIDPFLGIAKFMKERDSFVADVVQFFSSKTVAPGIVKF